MGRCRVACPNCLGANWETTEFYTDNSGEVVHEVECDDCDWTGSAGTLEVVCDLPDELQKNNGPPKKKKRKRNKK